MKGWIVLLALVAMSATAAERFDIRGVALGDSELQVQALGYSCETSDGVMAESLCTTRGFGEDPHGFVAVSIVSGAVESVTVLIDSALYGQTVMAMSEKYGPPKMEEATVSNAMGATFRNRTATWYEEGTSYRIVAEERAGRVNQSSFRLESIAGVKASAARFKASRAAAASNL